MVTNIGTQTIETERLILRRFEYSDIDSMIRNWIADKQTQWGYTTRLPVSNVFYNNPKNGCLLRSLCGLQTT